MIHLKGRMIVWTGERGVEDCKRGIKLRTGKRELESRDRMTIRVIPSEKNEERRGR